MEIKTLTGGFALWQVQICSHWHFFVSTDRSPQGYCLVGNEPTDFGVWNCTTLIPNVGIEPTAISNSHMN
jgi:hypothetical protein